MATAKDAVAKHNDAISKHLENVAAAAQDYQSVSTSNAGLASIKASGQVSEAKRELLITPWS